MEATYQSATQRKDLRRAIRNGLGTSGDAAPDARQAINAAHRMAKLLNLATGGRYQLRLIDARTGEAVTHTAALEEVAK